MPKSKIQEIIKIIEKEVPGSKIFLGTDEFLNVVKLPFDIDILDRTLGGGLPFGRFTLITGDMSTGKTLLSQLAVKSAQSRGCLACFVDAERTFDPVWWKKTGVNIEELLVCQPSGGEEALDIVIEMIRADVPLIILDSIAALIPTAEVERSTLDFLIGAQARLFNKGLRKITQANREGRSIFMGLNQTRQAIGPAGMPLEDALPAGKGQRFFASIELRLTRGGYIKDDNKKRIGINIHCRTVKNKIYTPFLECDIPFRWDQGAIDTEAGLLQIALDLNIVKKVGAMYSFKNNKFRGKLGILDEMKKNPQFVGELKGEIEYAEEWDTSSDTTGINSKFPGV